MPMWARVLMVAFALFGAWTMVRAWRTGEVFSESFTYSLDGRPMMFSAVLVTHGICVAFLLWLAAGYDGPGFLRLFGLDPDMFAKVAGWCFG